MFKDYKYSVISKMYITSFSRCLLLSTSNIRMSEGTFCRVEVHMYCKMVPTQEDYCNLMFLFVYIANSDQMRTDENSFSQMSMVLYHSAQNKKFVILFPVVHMF